MRNPAIFLSCASLAILAAPRGASAQPDCGGALAAFRAADAAGWTLSSDQASALADRLLDDLSAHSAEPCASRVLDAVVVTMGQCGRYGEAAMQAARALAAEPSADRRLLLANNFIGMKMKEANGSLDPGAMRECRAAAIAGLRGAKSLRECLDQGRLDYLVMVLPLHHVVASTEPTHEERLAALERLVDVCDASLPVAERQGIPSPVLPDRYWIIGEAARESGMTPQGSGASMAGWVRRVAWETGSHRDAGELVMQVVQDGRIPRDRRKAFVDALGPEMPDQGLRARAAYSLLSEEVRNLGASRDESVVSGVYDEVERVHALLGEIERASAGGVPAGLDASRWNAMVRMTLFWMWDLGWKRLHRPEAGLAAAAEHVQRFPNSNPTPAMQRFLADPASR